MFVDMRLKDTTYEEVTIRQRGCDKNISKSTPTSFAECIIDVCFDGPEISSSAGVDVKMRSLKNLLGKHDFSLVQSSLRLAVPSSAALLPVLVSFSASRMLDQIRELWSYFGAKRRIGLNLMSGLVN